MAYKVKRGEFAPQGICTMATIYEAAGIGDKSLTGLRIALMRISKAAHRIRDAHCPAPIIDPERPSLPDAPRVNGCGIHVSGWGDYPTVTFTARKSIGSVENYIMLDCLPIDLADLTAKSLTWAGQVEALADEYEASVAKRTREALESQDIGIIALTAHLRAEQEESRRLKEGEVKLQEWAMVNGSELLKARIAGEFSWINLAQEEYAKSAITCVTAERLPDVNDDEWGTKVEKRTTPTLEEIHALERTRTELKGQPASACLEWITYTRVIDRDDDDADSPGDEPEKKKQCEICVRVTCPDGTNRLEYFAAK